MVTSNKWPVSLRGVELAALAGRQGVMFRAESAVMSGTPGLSTLTEGLAGTVPTGLRGILNATANATLPQMADGTSYAEAQAQAQHAHHRAGRRAAARGPGGVQRHHRGHPMAGTRPLRPTTRQPDARRSNRSVLS